jgi:RNA polymerase sigma-70 factor, ECF subfamily
LKKEEFHKVFTSNYQELCRFAFVILNCADLADEIVQKSFVSFWENRNRTKIEKDIKSYLYKIVKNNALNYVKSDITRKNYEREFFLQSVESQNEKINDTLFRERLEKAITNLPHKCRMVYCLKYIEGLSYKEIATYLEISANTVDNHIQKALKYLKQELSQYKTEFYNK